MDNHFKQQTIGMVDKHLTILRNNLVTSVEVQREHTISTLQQEYVQMVDLEKQLELAASHAIGELNRVMATNIAAIHMTLSNVMAPITDRKLAIANKLSELEDFDRGEPHDVEDTPTGTIISLPAPRKGGLFRYRTKVKAAHG